MRNFYTDFQCCVKIAGELSEWFKARQAVHQGAPWSMYLYMKMNNQLLKKLTESNTGAKIGNVKCSNPAFADDIASVSLHKQCLQIVFDISYAYSKKWRFDFNGEKTEVIAYGKDLCPHRHLWFGGEKVRLKDGSSHMGVVLTDNKQFEAEAIADKISSSQKAYYAVQGIGSHRVPLTPAVASQLYWAISIPRLTHGCATTSLSPSSIKAMDQSHGHMAKLIQGLPDHTANPAPLATLGWLSIESHLDKLRLLFLWRLLSLSVHCIYKQILIERLYYHIYQKQGRHTGPTWDTLQTVGKYNLLPLLINALSTGIYLPMDAFKKIVKEKIIKRENERYQISSSLLYPTLVDFSRCISKIQTWVWWIIALKRPNMVQAAKIMIR